MASPSMYVNMHESQHEVGNRMWALKFAQPGFCLPPVKDSAVAPHHSKAMILKLEHASESPEGLLNTDYWDPPSEFLIMG